MTGLHVLLIDDSEADVFIHTRVITRVGCADLISNARDGADALAFLRRCVSDPDGPSFPDLIVVDINMPVMDGWAFVAHYEEEFAERYQSVIVVMVSTMERSGDAATDGRTGVVAAHIEKPLTEAHVRALLAKHFSGPSTSAG